LNFDGLLAGPVNTLPTSREKVHATKPAIAADGTSFFVAWLETYRFNSNEREIAGVLTDGDGKAIAAPVNLGLAVEGAPALVWNGLEYRLFASASYGIGLDGAARIIHFGDASRRVPFATPDANGWIDWSNELPRPACSPFLFFCGLSPQIPAAYNLDFTVVTPDWIRTGRLREQSYNATEPALVASERDLLLLWTTPQGFKGARLAGGETVRTFTLADPRAAETRPALAGSLAIFSRDGDVFGLPVEGDSFGSVFAISSGEPWDSEPRVYPAGENRYLVVYVREDEGDSVTLATRIVEM
jgi:hypothetical protein